jgi:hypothetical protein
MSLSKVAELIVSAQTQMAEATSMLLALMAPQKSAAKIGGTDVLPTYNSLFEDVLRVVNKVGPTNYHIVAAHLIHDLGITAQQLRIVQPKNREKSLFVFRVEWAMWYLSDSVATFPARSGHLHLDKATGLYSITQIGIDSLLAGISDDENRAIIKRVNSNSVLRAAASRPARIAAKAAKDAKIQVKTVKFKSPFSA